MKTKQAFLIASLLLSFTYVSCAHSQRAQANDEEQKETPYIYEQGQTVSDRFLFERSNYVRCDSSEYAEYLRSLPLKPHGYPTHYYNGEEKRFDVNIGVIDMEIGKENLQQCADAVIRLRAEYLFKTKQYDKIHFNFTNGFRCDYTKWAEGYRIKTNAQQTKTWWELDSKADRSYATFRKYLNQVFLYAGTASLEQELVKIRWQDVRPGDVIIQGGHPGHAVTILDVLRPLKQGLLIKIMICQSYMPAQEIEILRADDESPWFELNPDNTDGKFITPEWVFTSDDFRRF